MVQTPVGARCKACANLRRPVVYSVSPALLLRGIAAAAAVAVVVGFLWGYLIPHSAGAFGIFIFFPALGYGWLVAEAIGRVTNRRRGIALQVVAAASCVGVYIVHNLVAPPHVALPQDDIYGYIFVVIAGIVAVSYLR
jgi:hypothetical protein